VKEITKGFKIVPLTASIISRSFADKNLEDLEDAIQFHSAKFKGIKFLITRNKTHFANISKQIRILTPEEWLNL
jgi:hypothetical protein